MYNISMGMISGLCSPSQWGRDLRKIRSIVSANGEDHSTLQHVDTEESRSGREAFDARKVNETNKYYTIACTPNKCSSKGILDVNTFVGKVLGLQHHGWRASTSKNLVSVVKCHMQAALPKIVVLQRMEEGQYHNWRRFELGQGIII